MFGIEFMLVRTPLFWSSRSQPVRSSKAVAFGPEVHDVVIVPDGPRRIVAPAGMAWDDFFDEPGSEMLSREQPGMQGGDSF